MKILEFTMVALAAVILLIINLTVDGNTPLDQILRGATIIVMYWLGLYAKSLEK